MKRSLIAAAVILAAACTDREARSAAATPTVSSATPAVTSSAAPVVRVYKDPNCGCCNNWVEHLKQHGFAVETTDMHDLSQLKQQHGIGRELQSCHTALVGDYAIEGHVPADLIHKLLKEKPAVAGLAVPGMPIGSPGMEGAISERYAVLSFDKTGKTAVYAER
jgi:hypothetical protein